MTTPYGAAWRNQFLIEDGLTFLNNGSFGAPPKQVLAAQTEYRLMAERSPISFYLRDLPGMLRGAANTLGRFIGATGETIAFTENATTAINTVVFSIAPTIGPGDVLLTTSHVYGAVRQTLRHYARWTGATVNEIEMPFPITDSSEVVARVAAALSPKVKLAVLDHITSPSGIIYPIQELVNLCRERGIPVLVDGAHAPGMVDINIEELGADWYTGNCHKWLFAPKGCAFLRTAPERMAETHALVVSHGYRQGYTAEFDFTGTKDCSPFLTVSDSIRFYLESGGNAIAAYNRTLAIEMRRMLAETWGVGMPAPENMLGSLAALPVPGDLPAIEAVGWLLHDVLFDEYRIEVPIMLLQGKLWVRVSAQIFNEPDDYHKLAEAMPEAVETALKRV